MSDYQAKAVRNNMNEPPPNLGNDIRGMKQLEPQYEPGAFTCRLQAIENELKDSVRRNEDIAAKLLVQMKAGNSFSGQFQEFQHDFKAKIEPLQKEDMARFEVRLEACEAAANYSGRLSRLIEELIKYLF